MRLNFFHLSSPDLLFGFDSDPAQTKRFWLNRETSRISHARYQATQVRSRNNRKSRWQKNPLKRLDSARRCQMAANTGKSRLPLCQPA